jgi:hypothetical protein
MRYAGPGVRQFSSLDLPDAAVLATTAPFRSVLISHEASVQGGVGVGIGLLQLLFGGQAVRELLEHKIGLNWCYAADQNDQKPFHVSAIPII